MLLRSKVCIHLVSTTGSTSRYLVIGQLNESIYAMESALLVQRLIPSCMFKGSKRIGSLAVETWLDSEIFLEELYLCRRMIVPPATRGTRSRR